MNCKCKRRAVSTKTKLTALEWLDQHVTAKKKKKRSLKLYMGEGKRNCVTERWLCTEISSVSALAVLF